MLISRSRRAGRLLSKSVLFPLRFTSATIGLQAPRDSYFAQEIRTSNATISINHQLLAQSERYRFTYYRLVSLSALYSEIPPGFPVIGFVSSTVSKWNTPIVCGNRIFGFRVRSVGDGSPPLREKGYESYTY